MSAEILNQTPLSGDYPEKHFGQTYNSRLWVKFTDNDFQEWAGCFPRPYPMFDKVLTDAANETAFIVAGGQGYLIDISTRELLHQTGDLPALESLIHTTNPEYFIIGACYGIYIFDNRKLIKRYDPDFTVDGIYFTGQQDQKAIGHLYSYRYHQNFNVGFSFDLVTNELSINKKVKFRQLGPYEFINEQEGKEKEGFLTRILKYLIRNEKKAS